MPAFCEPCPGKSSASTRPLFLFCDLDAGRAVVVAALAADAVGRLGFAALRAAGAGGRGERVVGASLVLTTLRRAALRDCHLVLLAYLSRPFSASSFAKGDFARCSSQSQRLVLRSTPQCGQSPRQSSRQSGWTGNASVRTSRTKSPRSIS